MPSLYKGELLVDEAQTNHAARSLAIDPMVAPTLKVHLGLLAALLALVQPGVGLVVTPAMRAPATATSAARSPAAVVAMKAESVREPSDLEAGVRWVAVQGGVDFAILVAFAYHYGFDLQTAVAQPSLKFIVIMPAVTVFLQMLRRFGSEELPNSRVPFEEDPIVKYLGGAEKVRNLRDRWTSAYVLQDPNAVLICCSLLTRVCSNIDSGKVDCAVSTGQWASARGAAIGLFVDCGSAVPVFRAVRRNLRPLGRAPAKSARRLRGLYSCTPPATVASRVSAVSCRSAHAL